MVDAFLLKKLGIAELPDELAAGAAGLEVPNAESEGVTVEEVETSPNGLPNNVLLAALEGAEERGNIDGLPESAGFVDSPELGKAPKLRDVVTSVGPDFSVGFAKNEVAPLMGPGAEAEATSGGAPSPMDLASGVDFFCSCNLALILAIASASKSCFSHFENIRKPFRVGLSLAATGGKGAKADTTRRLGAACESRNGLMRSPRSVAIDSRKGRRLCAGDSWAAAAADDDAQSRFLPLIEGESWTSPSVSGSAEGLGVSCHANS